MVHGLERIASHQPHSNDDLLTADTVTQIVMAEQITHHVVKEAQSMGGPSPIDDTATSTTAPAGDGEAPSAPPTANPKSETTPESNVKSLDGASAGGEKTSEKAPADAAAVSGGACAHGRIVPYTDVAQHAAADAGTTKDSAPPAPSIKESLTNGDSAEHSAAEDTTAHGEASGGSDTDISRPGSVDPSKVRASSTKKHAPFKSVSVTKNFLAKSAVSTPTAGTGLKPAAVAQTLSSTAQPTQKPRLVMKSGSGLVSRSSLTKANGTGPDASKVWNKNQPVPPPPPKQFTDEELKQQYGIHLATRLQADESGKEAKWADIDDDEEDWVPENVQWMDGTKSSVATATVENVPPPEPPKPAPKKEVAPELAKPLPTPLPSSQRPTTITGGVKTILKPGAHAASANKAGLVLKGQPEKPTLVAKPSTAAPTKSPWAPLPPVDKVSPVQITPIQPPPPPRFTQRDSHGYDAMAPPHGPAREMAADDFNRAWRDDRGTRELFNSHSGRYEPVNDTRRPSFRDNNLRHQPSLLQRPLHDTPAEPSAAFQTSRTTGEPAAWGRRRGSSNVSGGSGGRFPMDRRTSELPPVAMNIQRRESHSINGADAGPGSARSQHFPNGPLEAAHIPGVDHAAHVQKPSPSLSNVQPVSPYGSMGPATPHEVSGQGLPVPVETAVEVQNRLMREKLERARLAKQKQREQEEREEAERKERLRKKLEALGMASEAKPKSKEPSPSRPAQKSPLKEKAVPATTGRSPPKPPVVTKEGEVAQYGAMKVHQSQPVKKATQPENPASKPAQPAPSPQPSVAPPKSQTEVQPAAAPPSGPHPISQLAPFPQDSRTMKPPAEQGVAQNQAPTKQPEAPRPSDNLKATQPPPSAWSAPLTQQQRPWAAAVWGPPQSQDRALGNGTFASGYNRGDSRPGSSQLPQQGQPGQPPAIGLDPTLNPSAAQAAAVSKPQFASQPMPPQQLRGAPPPGPIARPSKWSNFSAAIRNDDQAMVKKAQQNFQNMGGETFRPELHETYTDQQGNTQKKVHQQVGGNAAMVNGSPSEILPSTLKSKDEGPVMNELPPAVNQGTLLQSTGAGARSSRFFPRPSDPLPQPSAAPLGSASPEESGPPPPETESHPVHGGVSSSHIIVRLPKPAPRVRLPPSAIEGQSSGPVSMPDRARLGMGARPLALNPEWQARFNSLLHTSKPPGSVLPALGSAPPVRQSVIAIAASSKAPLDVRESPRPATVSLPSASSVPSATAFRTNAKRLFANDRSRGVTSKPMAEVTLLEEREFGSLPVVKLPNVPHLAAEQILSPAGYPSSRKRLPNIITTSKQMYFLTSLNQQNAETIDVVIRLPGKRESVTKSMVNKRENRRGNTRGPKRNFDRKLSGSMASQNPRSRKPSGNQMSSNLSPSTSQPPRGNVWNRNANSPAHASGSWARRAEPVQ